MKNTDILFSIINVLTNSNDVKFSHIFNNTNIYTYYMYYVMVYTH